MDDPKQMHFDDETLEREFSDPKEALDYDGDLVFSEENKPPVDRGTADLVGAENMSPKKNGGRGVVFLVIAAVLLVCSAVFAVLMFMRMNNSSNSKTEEPVASASVEDSTATGVNGGSTKDSATQPATETATQPATQPSSAPASEPTSPQATGPSGAPMSLEDFFRSSDGYALIKKLQASNDFHVDDNTVMIAIYYDGDAKSDDDAEKKKFENYIAELENVCTQLEKTITPMRQATGVDDAIIYIEAFDSKHTEHFFDRGIYPSQFLG